MRWLRSRPAWSTTGERAALVAAVVLVLAACSGGSPGPTVTPSGSTGWHRVTTPADGYALDEVVAYDSGLIAIGSGGLKGPGIAWVSSDGSTWSAGPAAAALATTPLISVAATGSGLVGLGEDCSSGANCGLGAMAIEAPSGGAWSVGANLPYTPSRGGLPSDARVEVTNLVASGLRIAAGGPTIVAVGYGGGLLQVNGTDYPLDVACAWTSTDGITWTAVPDGPALDRAEMLSVVYAKGEYLAVGEVQIAAGTDPSIPTGTDASVWTSPDGTTWTREPDAPAFADGVMQSVVAGGPGFVAVGTGSNGAAAWTSPDGTTWTRAPDSPSLEDGAMHGVAAGPGGLVAVGFDGSGAIAWHSTDGITWSRDPTGPDFAGAQALSVAALGERFVAVGGADPAGNPQAYVWLGD